MGTIESSKIRHYIKMEKVVMYKNKAPITNKVNQDREQKACPTGKENGKNCNLELQKFTIHYILIFDDFLFTKIHQICDTVIT